MALFIDEGQSSPLDKHSAVRVSHTDEDLKNTKGKIDFCKSKSNEVQKEELSLRRQLVEVPSLKQKQVIWWQQTNVSHIHFQSDKVIIPSERPLNASLSPD